MDKFLRASALACAAVCFSVSLAAAPAKAETIDSTRTAQMHLASLGYYVGRYDGTMGPTTEGAIMDFQRTNGLAVTGHLNAETWNLLLHRDYIAYHQGYYGYNHMVYADPILMDLPVAWNDRWNYVRTQELPSRFGRLDVNEETFGGVRHYAVMLNGQPVLFANNQPGILRASQTYKLDNEDAVIFTAYNGDGVCANKSYLLTVHSDGSFNSPKEIGNCAGNYEAHVAAGNMLLVSFPGSHMVNGWSTWDVWRYEHNVLARI